MTAIVKSPRQFDDLDRAANAVFRGEPLPEGWAVITGNELYEASEWTRLHTGRRKKKKREPKRRRKG